MNTDKLINIKFNIYGMKDDQNNMEILNTENLQVYSKDSIQDIKRMLSLKLFKKIEDDKKNKICKYCFKPDLITSKKTSPKKKKLKIPSPIDIKEDDSVTPLYKKMIPPTPIGDDDDNLSVQSLNDENYEDEQDFDDIYEQEMMDRELEMYMQGGAKSIKKCKNCGKTSKNEEIFPLPILLYFWDNENNNYIKKYDNEKEGHQIGHSFQIKKAKMDYVQMNFNDKYNFYKPFELLSKFMDMNKFNRMSTDFKSSKEIYNFIQKVDGNLFKIFETLQYNIDGNRVKHGASNKSEKYLLRLKNENLLLLSDFYDFSKNTDITINLSYFPEFCYLYKNREIKLEDVIYNLYWPFVNFKEYYDYYYDNKIKQEFQYSMDKTLNKWRDETREYKNIIDNMNDNIKDFISADERIYTTKVYFRINESDSDIQYINFSNIYHNFELDKNIPYLVTYVPEEGIFLERMWYPMRKLPDKLGWKLRRTEILEFYVKLPFQSNPKKNEDPEDIYIQVRLFENKQIDVNIPLKKEYRINLDKTDGKTKKKYMDLVFESVNNLINKLNKMEGGIYNNSVVDKNTEKLELINPKNTEIISINFLIDFKIGIKREIFEENFENLSNCLYPYFYKDYKKIADIESRNLYRYKRFDNYKNANEIDKFLYIKFQDIENDGRDKTKEKITIERISKEKRNELVDKLIDNFKITRSEASMIFKRFMLTYFLRDKRLKPINGTLFYIAFYPKDSEIVNIRLNSSGIRNFQEMNKMAIFLNKLVSLLYHITHKNKVSDKKFLKGIEYFEKNSLCGAEIKEKTELEDKEKKKSIESINVTRAKQYMSCNFKLLELMNSEDKNKPKTKKLIEKLRKKQRELSNKIDKNYSNEVGNRKILKETFPNLDLKKQNGEAFYNVQHISQPMGTGINPPPHRFVRFNYEREMDKFRNWPSCDNNQKGGGLDELTKDFYETYHEKIDPDQNVYIERRLLSKCGKGKSDFGYNKNDLRKMLRAVEMAETKIPKSKKELCKLIKKLIKRNENRNNESDDDLSSIDESDDINISTNVMKKQFKNLVPKINFEKQEKNMQKIFKTKNVKKFLLDSINNLENDLFIKLLRFFNLQKANDILEKLYSVKRKRTEIIKMRIIYEIYKLTNWNNNELKSFYKAIRPNDKNMPEPGLRKLLIESRFRDYKEEFIKYTDSEADLSSNLRKHLDKFWSTIKDKNILAINDFDKNGKPGGIVKQSTLNYFGRALSCPNYAHHLKFNKGSKLKIHNEGLVGYKEFDSYDVDEYENRNDDLRKMVCHPICYGRQNVKEKLIDDKKKLRYLFCSGEINYREYRKLDDKVKTPDKKNYIYKFGVNNPGELGKLPEDLHKIFNNFNLYLKQKQNIDIPSVFFKLKKNSDHIVESPSFVLYGTNKSKKNILEIMGLLFGFTKERIKRKIYTFIGNNKKIFNSLNQGILSFKFQKNIYNYLKYINDDYQSNSLEWTIDLLSQPGLLHKKGLNIIVFELNNDKELVIKPMKHLFVEDYYDINRPNVYLFHHDIGHIEPIILKFTNNDKIIGVFDEEEEENFKYKGLTLNQYRTYVKGLNNFIGKWFYDNFNKKESFPLLTAQETLNLIDPKNIKDLIQMVDSFHKVLYILDENKNLIPVKPSGYNYNGKIQYFENSKEIFKYSKSFKDTKKYLSNFVKEYINPLKMNKDDHEYLKDFYTPKKLIQNPKNKNSYIAIEFNKNIIIPIKPTNQKHLTVSDNFLEFDINEALFQKTQPKLNKEIIKDEYNKEIYNRYLLEFSTYLSKHNKIKNQLTKFISEYQKYTNNKSSKDESKKRNKYKKRIRKLISYTFYKISIPEYNLFDDIVHKHKEKKSNNNRRSACSLYQNSKSCNSDTYCKYDNVTNKCKIHIPMEKINTIIGKISEEFITNTQVAKNIINNNVDTIVDRFLFNENKEVDGMIYRKRPNDEKDLKRLLN